MTAEEVMGAPIFVTSWCEGKAVCGGLSPLTCGVFITLVSAIMNYAILYQY
jgi:hypothetical protein